MTNQKSNFYENPYFSLDEMIEYDIPATFDKVHQVTGQKKLWYIGHSQGASIILAKLSTYPDFHQRLNGVFALAPVVSVKNIRGMVPLFLNLPTFIDPLKVLFFSTPIQNSSV